MNRKGFTLTELLAVIAIIAILSVIIVPSVIKINKNINERLYNDKIEYIVSAAELYGSNKPDIFNGSDVVYVEVWQLVKENYLEIDSKYGEGACVNKPDENGNGCIIDPRNDSDNKNMNSNKIKLTKKSVGIVGEFEGAESSASSTSATLVTKVCNGFKNAAGNFNQPDSEYYGKFGTGANDFCHCVGTEGNETLVKDAGGSNITECIIVSNKESGEVNNWLKYGSSEANWRVLGVYAIDGNTAGKLSVKMITSDIVK